MPPFYSDDNERLLEMVSEGYYSFPEKYWKDISKEAKDLISKLLEKNPAKRYTAQQVLQHPWIVGANVSIKYQSCFKNIIYLIFFKSLSLLKIRMKFHRKI